MMRPAQNNNKTKQNKQTKAIKRKLPHKVMHFHNARWIQMFPQTKTTNTVTHYTRPETPRWRQEYPH